DPGERLVAPSGVDRPLPERRSTRAPEFLCSTWEIGHCERLTFRPGRLGASSEPPWARVSDATLRRFPAAHAGAVSASGSDLSARLWRLALMPAGPRRNYLLPCQGCKQRGSLAP